MILNEVKLKLTEKEVNTIVYLSNAKNPVSVNKLEELCGNINLILKPTLLKLISID